MSQQHPTGPPSPVRRRQPSGLPSPGARRLVWLLGALGLGLAAPGCSDEQSSDGTPPAECPGELADARCLKACGIAVETTATAGLAFVLRQPQQQPLRQSDPVASYSPTFAVSGARTTLALPVSALAGLQAGTVSLPLCIPLAGAGGEAGLAQYIPSGNTFSTDSTHRGMVAILDHSSASGAISGIFQFEARLLGGGGAGAESDPAGRSITIDQGYFRADPQ